MLVALYHDMAGKALGRMTATRSLYRGVGSDFQRSRETDVEPTPVPDAFAIPESIC